MAQNPEITTGPDQNPQAHAISIHLSWAEPTEMVGIDTLNIMQDIKLEEPLVVGQFE